MCLRNVSSSAYIATTFILTTQPYPPQVGRRSKKSGMSFEEVGDENVHMKCEHWDLYAYMNEFSLVQDASKNEQAKPNYLEVHSA